ncbi:MAG: phenylalanine--tRNA ligase subunit alpha [Candidatus Omnitrophota bacterium]
MPNFDFQALEKEISENIQNINSREALEELKIKYLGRKGLIAQITASIPGLESQEKAFVGQNVNILKNKITQELLEKEKILNSESVKELYNFDNNLPAISHGLGHKHPISLVMEGICDIFTRLGFLVVEGPEIENEHNNFTALNIPLDHPSRDAFDTFYLETPNSKLQTPNLLLRSHTSPSQIRIMQDKKPPLAVVVPGVVYRPDAVDASHSFMFHQIEGLLVDRQVKFSDLKGVLGFFVKEFFGKDVKMRFRPHFFPFTEPSAEVDISCIMCQGKGCSACGRKGWLEILGAGMVHSNVFKAVGYNSKIYNGFAFGMGVERIAMLKYNIDDIRLFFENDLRFLRQF